MGALDEEGKVQRAPRAVKKKERTGPRQYLREVRDEMRKVAWPKRPEVKRYSIIVVVTIIVYTGDRRRVRLRVQQAVRMVLFDVSDETMSDEMTTDRTDRRPSSPTPLTDAEPIEDERHRPRRSRRSRHRRGRPAAEGPVDLTEATPTTTTRRRQRRRCDDATRRQRGKRQRRAGSAASRKRSRRRVRHRQRRRGRRPRRRRRRSGR